MPKSIRTSSFKPKRSNWAVWKSQRKREIVDLDKVRWDYVSLNEQYMAMINERLETLVSESRDLIEVKRRLEWALPHLKNHEFTVPEDESENPDAHADEENNWYEEGVKITRDALRLLSKVGLRQRG